jgi:hypothetical protein
MPIWAGCFHSCTFVVDVHFSRVVVHSCRFVHLCRVFIDIDQFIVFSRLSILVAVWLFIHSCDRQVDSVIVVVVVDSLVDGITVVVVGIIVQNVIVLVK